MDFSTIEITLTKVRGNNMDSSIIEIKSNGTKWIFRSTKIHRKCTSKQRGFFDQRNYIEKVRGTDMEIRRHLVFDV